MTKGPTGALERKPFEVRHEWTERQWYLVRTPPLSALPPQHSHSLHLCLPRPLSCSEWVTAGVLGAIGLCGCLSLCDPLLPWPSSTICHQLPCTSCPQHPPNAHPPHPLPPLLDTPMRATPQSDDSGTCVRVGRAKEAAASELRDAVEVRQDYTERRDGGAAPLQSLHQVIT